MKAEEDKTRQVGYDRHEEAVERILHMTSNWKPLWHSQQYMAYLHLFAFKILENLFSVIKPSRFCAFICCNLKKLKSKRFTNMKKRFTKLITAAKFKFLFSTL